MNIELELKAVSERVTQRAEAGQVSAREIAALLECYHSYTDLWERLEETIFDGRMEWNDAVTVKVDGKTIKFDDIDQVAEWLTNEPK